MAQATAFGGVQICPMVTSVDQYPDQTKGASEEA